MNHPPAAQVTALRNARLSSATVRTTDAEARAAIQASAMALGAALPLGVQGEMDDGKMAYAATVTRQMLQRRIAYADYSALPNARKFQLHQDLQGWMSSPSRLDFLYKELIRQRNTAVIFFFFSCHVPC